MCNRALLLECFYGGSHKQLMEFIYELLDENNVQFELFTLPAKKWHWRARTSALYMSQMVPKGKGYDVLFSSSVLNLAELVALRPDLLKTKKIVYFHENQFIYPTQNEQCRDFQYGYNTILSAIVADVVVFNSIFNKDTFLNGIEKHLKKQPGFFVGGLKEKIEPKCTVIYFPVKLPRVFKPNRNNDTLHIVWPHRWEHDKNPELLFDVLFKLKELVQFKVSILGTSFNEQPPIFEQAKQRLEGRILNFGRMPSKEDYLACLQTAHVVVSTAKHEFFGVSMFEAVLCGCYPIAPANLVYPELYPLECLYETPQQLLNKLRRFCEQPHIVNEHLAEFKILPEHISIENISSEFFKHFVTK